MTGVEFVRNLESAMLRPVLNHLTVAGISARSLIDVGPQHHNKKDKKL